MTRIVLFHGKLVNPGGAERLLIEEYRYLKVRGIDTRVVTFAPCHAHAFYGSEMGPDLSVLTGRGTLGKVLALRAALAQLAPEVVVTAAGLRYLYLATRLYDVPYVVHQHEPPLKAIVRNQPPLFSLGRRNAIRTLKNADLYRFIPAGRDSSSFRADLEAFIDSRGLRAARMVTVLSRQAAQEVKLLYDRPAEVARGAISSAEVVDSTAREPEILSVSRLDPLKRIDLIIRAFGILIEQRDDARLVVCGTGPDERRLRALVDELDLNHAVKFIGYVSDADLWDRYQSARVFVLADWTDFDITPYEALSFGCVVVGSSEMEIEQALLEEGFVLQADPLPEDYARALAASLEARPDGTPSLEALTWKRYFERSLAPLIPTSRSHVSPSPTVARDVR